MVRLFVTEMIVEREIMGVVGEIWGMMGEKDEENNRRDSRNENGNNNGNGNENCNGNED